MSRLIYEKTLIENGDQVRKLFYSEENVPTENDIEITYKNEELETVNPTRETFVYGTEKLLKYNDTLNKIAYPEDHYLTGYADDKVVLGSDSESPVSNYTKFYINIPQDAELELYTKKILFIQEIDKDTTIDWGDGNVEIAENNWQDDKYCQYEHTYSTYGKYIIKLISNNGNIILSGYYDSSTYSSYNMFVDNAFNGKTNYVNNIIIGTNVTEIGADAFNGCFSLQSITIPKNVTEIGLRAFSNCTSLKSINIPNSVTEIGNGAFLSCTSLQSVNIPSSVTKIGNDTFSGCTSLQSITLPNSITKIGEWAFSSCSSLQSITISNSVTEIGRLAFGNCTAMQEYHFNSINPPTLLWSNVFKNIPEDCIIYVPQESVNAYKTAQNWSDYASYIQGE